MGGDVALEKDPQLAQRVERLSSIPSVGPITALTWALEIGEVSRFASLKHAVSYCGLCSAEISSAGVQKRSRLQNEIPETANGCLVLRTAGTPQRARRITLYIHHGGFSSTSTGQLRLPVDFS